MAGMQLKDKQVAMPVESSEPPREKWGVSEIHKSLKVVQARTQLPRTKKSQCARGELIVMAQTLQIFRPEQYIHDDRVFQEFR